MAATARAGEEEKQEPITTMETPTSKNPNSNSKTPPWTLETNWTISRGSLEASIAVESSDFPISESESLGPTSKSPLVLKPSGSQSGPCEIKISFSQKHEIRQVYVRSTSRVYEIHYASTPQCEDEYLCTVRCIIAAREDDLLHASNLRETVSANSEGFGREAAQVKMMGGSSSGTSEDDWVEVKIPNILHDNRNKSLLEQPISKTRSFQDFYEATAEISDVDPCISITLRLLSLQSKGCVYVDEVYVFAEPLKSAGSEDQIIHAENSAGSSLMAMLVPTLLQLSKSGVGRIEDHVLSSKETQEHLEIESRASSTSNSASGIQQVEQNNATGWQNVKLHVSQLEEKVRWQETYMAIPEPNQLQAHAAVPHGDKSDTFFKNGHHSCIQVERVLEQLVSRVSRIEDLCLRFEENMLKPINSIVERLQRVEQQVEVLAKNSLSAGLPSGTSAPAFSSNESNSSSFFNDGNSSQPCGTFELEKKDTTSSKPDDQQFLPSLVMTAPEFSCCDDEEESDVSAPPKISPQRKSKPAVSIDDALAAALAGLSSMTCGQSSVDKEYFKAATSESASKDNVTEEPSECIEAPVAKLSGVSNDDEPSKFTQSLKVTAPEFTVEENGNEDKVSAPSNQKGKSVVPSGICAIGKTNCVSDSMSTSTSAATIESARHSVQSLGNMEGIYEVECPFPPKNEYHRTKGIGELDNINLLSRVSISENADILKQFDAYQTSNGSDATQFDASARTRDFEDQSDREISSNVPRSSYVSMVDFEIPILDVKFSSRDISSSTLEALLTDVGEISLEAPAQENDDIISQEIDLDFVDNGVAMSLSAKNNLLVELDGCSGEIILDTVENGETMSSPAKDHLLVELDGNGVEEVHVDMASDGMQDHLTSFNQEIIASLI